VPSQLTLYRLTQVTSPSHLSPLNFVPLSSFLNKLRGHDAVPLSAFHEAGHAVIAWRMGQWVREPGLYIDGMGNGNAAIQCGLPVGRGLLPSSEWTEGDAGATMILAVHLGGYAAEWRLIGAAPPAHHWPWESRDYRNAIAVATACWGGAKSSPAVQSAVRRAQREAKRLMTLPDVWEATTALAETLLWEGSVGEDAACDILERHLGCGWLPTGEREPSR